MRLIDADALLKYWSVHPITGERFPLRDCDNFYIDIHLEDVQKSIRSAPTITPEVLVVHGYWVHNEISSEHSTTGTFLLPECQCNECGCFVQQESPFCPNCGAKMDMKL